ncbi:MAG: hypothetical protein SGJ20_10435, partial [Planctomycetota bacterium]|nr:hypothetical protein [Planctomycetota bacterium]
QWLLCDRFSGRAIDPSIQISDKGTIPIGGMLCERPVCSKAKQAENQRRFAASWRYETVIRWYFAAIYGRVRILRPDVTF